MKVSILLKPTKEFRKRNDIAIHLLEPSVTEIADAIETLALLTSQWVKVLRCTYDNTNLLNPNLLVY